MVLMDGRSFTGNTVNTNVALLVAAPSVAKIVMLAVPDRFGAGVTVIVRLAPAPASTTFALGTSTVSEERPTAVTDAIGESTSPTTNGIAPVVPSSEIVTALVNPEMNGASFTGLTVTVKEREMTLLE